MEQGGVRENTVERGRRQRELQKILVPHRTAGVLSRHLAERRAPVQPDRLVAQFPEVEKIPAGTAAQIEQAKPRSFGQSVEEGRVVLGDIMVLRPLPKAFGVSLVVMEGTGGDIFQIAGREQPSHDASIAHNQGF